MNENAEIQNQTLLMNSETLKFEKYKFRISLFKWLLGSVAIVIVTIIIDNGFKERTAGIQEMQAFDKYVEIILKADNIEERWKLAEFFSTVTPTDRLREKWLTYKNTISVNYDTFQKLKEKEYFLSEEIKEGKSPEAMTKLNQVRKQLEPYETKLAEPANYKITPNNELEGKLKSFKEEIGHGNEVPTSTRLKLEDIFTHTTNISTQVIENLEAELGQPYHAMQSIPIINYKDATYSIDPGITSANNYRKTIRLQLSIKILTNEIIFKLTENETTDSLKLPVNNINWGKVIAFERNFFLKRLDQLK